MTDLTLRAYIKKIDNLVEHSNLDEAIAHCRYILQAYPKHLETYRLLGKSYLEAKRYGDASDIFQRVLSAVPDDFVSHIGMAIVREDEGNLDSAIWHMERAFETNPANPAIQQELKRLIGRRDNVEPHKVRLTRGALARMYAQGELYPQAIAELRGALQDDSDRPDLQVLLARMFWKTDQWAEAADVCGRILEKLPYCREANKIMAVILQANNKLDEASTYHRRLASLDPYAAYVEKATIDPQTVDSDSVMMLELDWRPGQPLPSSDLGSNTWADSLGIEIDSSSPPLQPEPEKPSWVDGMRSASADQASAAAASAPPTPPANHSDESDEADIPQWMQDAGWQQASGEAVEGPVSFSDQELASLERGGTPVQDGNDAEFDGELTPAEIPSWLQDIAPSEQSAKGAEMSAKSFEGSDNEKLPDWLSDIAAEADDVTPEPLGSSSEDLLPFQPAQAEATVGDTAEAEEIYDEPDTASAVPTWLEESKPGATDTIVGWLGDRPRFEKEEPARLDAAPDVVQSEASESQLEGEEIPTWIGEAQASDMPSPAPAATTETDDSAPEWLAGIAEDTEMPSPEVAAPEQAAPDWLQGIAEEPAQEAQETEPPQWLSESAPSPASESVDQATPDWLMPEEGEEIITPVEDIPGWLAQEAAEAGIDTSAMPQEADWMGAPGEAAPEISEPIQEAAAEQLQEPTVDAQEESTISPVAEAPAQEPVDDIVQAQAPAEELADPPPPWLQQEVSSENMTTQEIYPIPEELKQAAQAATGEIPESTEDDEVFRWLEGLAARQGADESELTTPEELRPTEPPSSIAAVEQLIADESLAIPEEPEQGLDWLEQLASERGLDLEVEPSSDMSTMEPAAEEMAEEIEPDLEMASEAPGWLQDMQAEARQAPTPAAETAQVDEVVQPEPDQPSAEVAEAMAEAEMDTEAPPWLKEMAEESDTFGEEAATFSEVAAQIQSEPVEEAEPAAEVVEAAPEPAQPQSELDWLSAEEAEAERVGAQVEDELSATDWLNRMADDTEETITAPQVMMQEQAQELESEAEQAQPAVAEEQPPQVIEPTPDLVEEIAAEVNDFWAAEDESEEAAPEPVAEEAPVPSQAGSPIETAHLALDHGDIEGAAAIYEGLIQEGRELDGIIAKLKQYLSQNPDQALLWQTLGDAYMNNDQLNEAIEAYQKGTEVA